MSDLTWTNEKRKLGDLVPWPRNPRQINEAEGKRLAESLDEFGQVDIIAIGPEDEVYNGHQRINVWIAEHGPDFEADVRVASRALTEKEREKLTVLLHRGAVGEWDFDALASWGNEAELVEWGFELEELGFVQPDPPADPGAQIDRAAELQEQWGTERGQVWEIPSMSVSGRCHRVMCGDSTSAEDVGRLMGEETPYLTVTDPPYGVDYDPAWRQRAAEEGRLAYAASRVGEVQNDDCADWQAAFALSPSSVVYCWQDALRASNTQQMLESSGFVIRSQIVWAKPHFPISRGNYHWRHEPCWYAVRNGKIAQWIGDRKQTTVWDDITLDKNVEGGHSTQKPVECMARPIHNHEGDVYDPFLGSGTTLVACEQTARVGYGMEIEPKYVAVTLQRLADMGLEPRLVEPDPPA